MEVEKVFAPIISQRVLDDMKGKVVKGTTHFGQAIVIQFETGEIVHIYASDEGAHRLSAGITQRFFHSVKEYETHLSKLKTKDIAYGGPKSLLF